MQMKHINLIIIFLAVVTSSALAQTATPDTLAMRMWRQVNAFPQEKLYTQTDRAEYTCGDTIWMRHHVVDALTGVPSYASRYVYVELVNPMGSMVSRVMMRQDENGAIYGYMPTTTDMPSGQYMLRAYTRYMAGTTPDYLFQRPLHLLSPMRNSVKIIPALDGGTMRMTFVDPNTGKAIQNGSIKVTNAEGDVAFTGNTAKGVRIHTLDIGSKQQCLLVRVGNYEEFVPVVRQRIDLQLMPEGGHTVVGQRCRVAYKAVSQNGIGIDMKAVVIDGRGDTVAVSERTHRGMGMFYITPESDHSYKVMCTASDGCTATATLPKAELHVPSLSVAQNSGSIIVSILRPEGYIPQSPLWLVAHQGGVPLFTKQMNQSSVRFERSVFRDGIAHFVLVDNNFNIVSERLAFVWNGSGVYATANDVKTSEVGHGMRRVSISLPDTVNANCALSITDAEAVCADTLQDIVSTLLLSQELRGHVEQPAWYFANRGRTGQLDLLMLTQGWRRYDVQKTLKGDITETKVKPETSMSISGVVTSDITPRGKKNVVVTMSSNRGGLAYTGVTDALGRFCFNSFEMPDSTGYMLMAQSAKGSMNVVLRVDKMSYPAVATSLSLASPSDSYEYSDISTNTTRGQSWSHKNGMVFLPEIEVNAIKPPRTQYELLAKFGGTTIHRESLEKEGNKSILNVLRNACISGLMYNSDREWFNYRNKEVYLFVDGTLVSSNYDRGNSIIDTWSMIQAYMQSLLASDVYQVDILKGHSVNGLPGIGGIDALSFDKCAILITTNRSSKSFHRTNVALINPLGYQRPAAFYNPKFDALEKYALRQTVYWNPTLRIIKGKLNFEFIQNGERELRLNIEGVDDKGKILNMYIPKL